LGLRIEVDGIRAHAVKTTAKSISPRVTKELRSRFGEITNAIKELPIDECVIDGEVVALDEEGRSSFQLLQALEMEGRKSPVRFYVFDLLQLNGKSLLHLPLMQRKQLLARICESFADPIRYSGEIGSDAKSLLAEVKRRGLEGLIGKLGNSVYEPGRRSGSWIKLKCVNEQEFVIGEYAASRIPQTFRRNPCRLLHGQSLDVRGKVGTGFTARSLSILHNKFRAEQRDDCRL
jgi:bifunctional non-homologous end joining protein LigD